ncbi:DUF6332 family protein [Streptomyces sp. RerS4]|uniref:DUF6332 family protein n=1 Tax=Streptomyces sp. RerS4 TaxID=2942449 RepID=UPI00201C59D0|nr:DUF6332 family protein [Streptomyces sp. RerS4]UQW99910.1 DUF6332 family protein [Streptomyces sp. RerS4]
MSGRTTAERDAVTVEIGYAFVTGCLAAALVFAAGCAVAWLLPLPGRAAGNAVVVAGTVLAGVVFVVRVVRVLWRFGRRGPGAGPGAKTGTGGEGGQPSVEA